LSNHKKEKRELEPNKKLSDFKEFERITEYLTRNKESTINIKILREINKYIPKRAEIIDCGILKDSNSDADIPTILVKGINPSGEVYYRAYQYKPNGDIISATVLFIPKKEKK